MNIDNFKYEVSVILTLFNSKEYFFRAIKSVINQTANNVELVIVDDGSTDYIETELFPLLKENKNFKYIRHSNRKHPLTLNTGIVISSGELITFLDSDDEYQPGHLEERINFFEKNPEVDLIYSPATLIGIESDFLVPDARDESKLISLNECIIGGTLFGKRKVFEELGGFKDFYGHDFEFYNRAVNKYEVRKFDSPTYVYYRNNPNSIISKMKESNL